ncbi:hypothetical protein [Runella sp.]|uniref:hypothetical protein n=1 Tax=Runella sp. TaxID=1960881 RepID=UPI003D1506F7
MKTLPRLNWWICVALLVLISGVTSCKKEDPEPPLADQIAGEYTGTSYTIGTTTTINLPATNAAGQTATAKISVKKITDEQATFTVTATVTDKAGKVTNGVSTLEALTLKKSVELGVEGYQGTTKLVTLVNGVLSVRLVDPDPQKTIVFYGKKD